MRIIGGKHRGRILNEFKGRDIRPTSDRAREALFNIFSSEVIGADFLDLFAGSGAVGLEALSRGAKSVVFTDINRQSTELIKKNLALLGETADVLLTDGTAYLANTDKKFDFIFIDPPYASSLGVAALNIISASFVLRGGGIAVYESDSEFSGAFSGLKKLSTRRYGKNHFNIYLKGDK